MSTKHATQNTIQWHHVDAKDRVLGRLATEVVSLVTGKDRSDYRPNTVPPVRVVVTNSDHVVLTGRKEQQKLYRHYTGHPGGLRERPAAVQRQRDSRKIVEYAVAGMLPKNNLRKMYMQNVRIFPGDEHPHRANVEAKEAKS